MDGIHLRVRGMIASQGTCEFVQRGGSAINLYLHARETLHNPNKPFWAGRYLTSEWANSDTLHNACDANSAQHHEFVNGFCKRFEQLQADEVDVRFAACVDESGRICLCS